MIKQNGKLHLRIMHHLSSYQKIDFQKTMIIDEVFSTNEGLASGKSVETQPNEDPLQQVSEALAPQQDQRLGAVQCGAEDNIV